MILSRKQKIKKIFNSQVDFEGNSVSISGKNVGDINGTLKFISDINDSSDSFQRQWTEYPKIRHDSETGTTGIEHVIRHRTNWNLNELEGKLVLECGGGAGADSEVLLKYGADLVTVDLTTAILEDNRKSNNQLVVQASIDNLPFKHAIFDVVYCHRVIMHTNKPDDTLNQILKFVKPGGAVFVHTYARNIHQMLQWKYVLRPLTTRLNRDFLFKLISRSAPTLMKINEFVFNIRPNWLGRFLFRITNRVIPVRNYHLESNQSVQSYNKEEIISVSIHDTFDALAPKTDKPLSGRALDCAAKKINLLNYEIIKEKGVTLLRSKSLNTE